MRTTTGIILLLALFGASPALAQTGSAKTAAQLNTEVNQLWPDQLKGQITPFNARQTLLDLVASSVNPLGGAFSITGSQTIPVIANSPLTGSYFGANTGSIFWCPGTGFGCAPPANFTGQIVAIATTAGPPNQQESAFFSLVNANTGFAAVWSTSTSYSANTYVSNGLNLFIETNPSCTSANAGGGPTGAGTGIVDGTCLWNFAGPSYANGKQAANFNIQGNPGGGKIWGSTSTAFTESGWNAQFAAGAEIDAGNFSSIGTQFGVGPAQIFNLYLGGVNGNPITAALNIAPQPSSGGFASQYGIILNGTNAFSSGGIINNSTGSTVGYVDQGSHTSSGISEASTSPVGINMSGTYASAAINISSAATNSIQIPSGKNICFNGGAGCAAWDNGRTAISTPGLEVSSGGSNANFWMVTTNQTWLMNTNASNLTYGLFDATNSKTPFSVAANSANNTLQVGTSGITVLGPIVLSGATSGAVTLTPSATGGHLNPTSSSTPTLTAGCNGAGSVVSGTDIHGTITGQTAAATTCTLTFGTSFGAAPDCVPAGQSSAITSYTSGTGTLVVNFASTANFKWSYHCFGT